MSSSCSIIVSINLYTFKIGASSINLKSSSAMLIYSPRLPLPVFVCVRVSRATNALILLRPKEIRMHRMRGPSEHVSPFPRTTSTLMFVSDKLRRPRMRHPAESAFSVFFHLCFIPVLCSF